MVKSRNNSKARVEVLVSTMHQKNHDLPKTMNIQTDAIIINQCDKNEFEEFNLNGNSIRFLSFAERGVGLSRNNALMRATGDICLFADDDITYIDDYQDVILKSFEENPEADMILFNFDSNNLDRPEYTITKYSRVRWYNCLRYPTYRIAVRTDKLRLANINFTLLFGGGAKYSAGEDNIFITEFLRKGFKIYAHPKTIGYVSHEESTWFEGYTKKYFIDKGFFYGYLYKKWSYLMCIQDAIRHRNLYKDEMTTKEVCRLMFKGIRTEK